MRNPQRLLNQVLKLTSDGTSQSHSLLSGSTKKDISLLWYSCSKSITWANHETSDKLTSRDTVQSSSPALFIKDKGRLVNRDQGDIRVKCSMWIQFRPCATPKTLTNNGKKMNKVYSSSNNTVLMLITWFLSPVIVYNVNIGNLGKWFMELFVLLLQYFVILKFFQNEKL